MTVLNMKNKKVLTAFFCLISALSILIVCVESNVLFSLAVALFFTMTGVFIGWNIKSGIKWKAIQIWILTLIFVTSVLISIAINILIPDGNGVWYIVGTNLFFILLAIFCIFYNKRSMNKTVFREP